MKTISLSIRSIACGLYMLLVICFLQNCKQVDTTPHLSSNPTTAVELEVFSLQKDILTTQFQIPGELMPFQQVDIYAKENSFVKKLYVDVGTEVKPGQLLASMEAPEITSQLGAAESRLKSQEAIFIASKANYNRLLETSKTAGTIAPNDLDFALAKMNSDNAQWDAAKSAYQTIADTRNYLEIKAPFGGIISSKNVDIGAYVGPSGKGSEFPMFTLKEQKKLRLVVAVPEAQISYLHVNDTIHFNVNAYLNQTFKAQIKRLAGVLDEKLRAQRIEMDVNNSDKKLLPGMVAEVHISLKAKDSLFVVPRSAIVNSPERVFVIQVKDHKANWIDIKKGRESNGRVEVFGKLNQGDYIVLKANEEIRQSSTVSEIKVIK